MPAVLHRRATGHDGRVEPRIRGWLTRSLASVALVGAVSGVIAVLQGHTRTASLAVLYLLAVLPVAIAWGAAFGVLVSVLSAAAFAFFFVAPRYSFTPIGSDDWVGLAMFLVTAIVVSQLAARSREQARESARLAEKQAVLRRMATLVARGVPPDEVFAAVTEEVGRLAPSIEATTMLRYEADGAATVMAGWSAGHAREAGEAASGERRTGFEAGARVTLEGENVAMLVLRTHRPARIDTYRDATGSLAAAAREMGMRSAAGAPIRVDGRLWGVMYAASTRPEPLPAGTESRIAEFTDLLGTAISNAQARAELTASRARIVAAGDAARRRIQRDLHDGAQQQLVSLGLELRALEAALPAGSELRARLARTAGSLAGALQDLQEISHGIHPAILSKGGLGPALKTLARRSALPVKVDVGAVERLPQPLEVATYFAVSEALTNATKHARASAAQVHLEVRDGTLRLSVCDDGVGGADPSRGSGLVGLTDRVEALGGTIAVTSPPGEGTSVVLELPVELR
jgi:signal transduction histidine kinase